MWNIKNYPLLGQDALHYFTDSSTFREIYFVLCGRCQVDFFTLLRIRQWFFYAP